MRLPHDGLKKIREDDSQNATQEREDKGFSHQHAQDTEPGKAQGLENAYFASTLHDHGVHIEKHDKKADDDAKADHGASKRFQLRKIGGTHERDVFGDRTDPIQRVKSENFRASSFRVALAANVEHGDAILGAGDVLRRLKRDEVAGAFAMGDDPTDCKLMIQKSDLVADSQMLGSRDDVIGDGFVGRGKGTPFAK